MVFVFGLRFWVNVVNDVLINKDCSFSFIIRVGWMFLWINEKIEC